MLQPPFGGSGTNCNMCWGSISRIDLEGHLSLYLGGLSRHPLMGFILEVLCGVIVSCLGGDI